MAIEVKASTKLSEDDEAFLKKEWAIIEGERGGLSTSGGIAITAKNGDETVGVAKGWYAGGVAYVIELMVASGRRSSGVGKRLLEEFEREAELHDSRRLALRVLDGSPAVRFYEREGWHKELEVEDWLDGHTYFQMRKDLA